MMRTLTPAQRRALRAKAHHLHPFVIVGQHGLTPAVLHEIDISLLAHELIKIRVFGDKRDEREALLLRICTGLDAAPVQHLGKVLTLWRPAAEAESAAPKPRAKAAPRAGKSPRSKSGERDRKSAAQGGAASASTPAAAPRVRRGAGRGGVPVTFEPDPVARRRKPGTQGDVKSAFALEPSARRRKAGARTDRRAPLATEPTTRRRRAKRQ
jgi:RNA-binding protein